MIKPYMEVYMKSIKQHAVELIDKWKAKYRAFKIKQLENQMGMPFDQIHPDTVKKYFK